MASVLTARDGRTRARWRGCTYALAQGTYFRMSGTNQSKRNTWRRHNESHVELRIQKKWARFPWIGYEVPGELSKIVLDVGPNPSCHHANKQENIRRLEVNFGENLFTEPETTDSTTSADSWRHNKWITSIKHNNILALKEWLQSLPWSTDLEHWARFFGLFVVKEVWWCTFA